MPELPEVESVVRALSPVLAGRKIRYVRVLNKSSVAGSPAPLAQAAGRRIEALQRRGKFILFRLEGGCLMLVHLRMTGWLGVKEAKQVRAGKDKFIRIEFALESTSLAPRAHSEDLLLFRDIRKFGRVWFGPREKIIALKSFHKLGPEPLAIEPQAFAARLRARRGRLKSLLLDQTFLAGLGNIYADEALFAARLHPLAQAQRVRTESALRLHTAIREVLERAIGAGGSSIDDYLHPDGTPGWFQRELKAYGREGLPCVRCKEKMRRIVLGQRGTWFCAKCQKKT